MTEDCEAIVNQSQFITLSETAKEHKFTQMLLQEIAGIETPVYIYGGN